MGSGWRWVARGWPGVGWMKEGGQAERSTRGGLRGRPGGARGEKLEKGRFKYQAPRGGPRSVFLAPYRPPSTTLSVSLLPSRLVSFSLSISLLSPFALTVLTLSTLFRPSSLRFFSFPPPPAPVPLPALPARSSLMHPYKRRAGSPARVHTQGQTHAHAHTRLSILGQRKGVLEPVRRRRGRPR